MNLGVVLRYFAMYKMLSLLLNISDNAENKGAKIIGWSVSTAVKWHLTKFQEHSLKLQPLLSNSSLG